MAWNFVESLKASRTAMRLGADVVTKRSIPNLYTIPDCPITRSVIEDGKRDGFDVDRERLQGDLGQIGLYFKNAVDKLGLEG